MMQTLKSITFSTAFVLMSLSPLSQADINNSTPSACPVWLDHSFRQLHSSNTINLCSLYNNKPILLVNTASHCGFTHQFSGLEKLYQRYKDQGLQVVGFASNDFNQAANSEAKAASICYENYGVTFTMMAPISVKGKNAHPLFKSIAEKSQSPSWNFNKYLISADGSSVKHYSADVAPSAFTLNNKIKALLDGSLKVADR